MFVAAPGDGIRIFAVFLELHTYSTTCGYGETSFRHIANWERQFFYVDMAGYYIGTATCEDSVQHAEYDLSVFLADPMVLSGPEHRRVTLSVDVSVRASCQRTGA